MTTSARGPAFCTRLPHIHTEWERERENEHWNRRILLTVCMYFALINLKDPVSCCWYLNREDAGKPWCGRRKEVTRVTQVTRCNPVCLLGQRAAQCSGHTPTPPSAKWRCCSSGLVCNRHVTQWLRERGAGLQPPAHPPRSPPNRFRQWVQVWCWVRSCLSTRLTSNVTRTSVAPCRWCLSIFSSYIGSIPGESLLLGLGWWNYCYPSHCGCGVTCTDCSSRYILSTVPTFNGFFSSDHSLWDSLVSRHLNLFIPHTFFSFTFCSCSSLKRNLNACKSEKYFFLNRMELTGFT